jgi:hypothetical protein
MKSAGPIPFYMVCTTAEYGCYYVLLLDLDLLVGVWLKVIKIIGNNKGK